MRINDIARVVHEANRAIQIIQDVPGISVSPEWDKLDGETRESAIDGVYGVLAGNTPEESHENWMKFKKDNGWKFGPVKNEGFKTHPLLIPYSELDSNARMKDDLFCAIVQALESYIDIESGGK
jgi:hypothetical protein